MVLLMEMMERTIFFTVRISRIPWMKLSYTKVCFFDPTTVPKGLSATKGTVPKALFKKQLVDFFVTKKSKPKHGNIEQLHTINT
jgi:hypothetical protein